MNTVGSINDAGMLMGLTRKGFTHEKCLSELTANSIDAGAKHLQFKVTQQHIALIDDGNGMNQKAIENMFDMHKENHAEHKSLGVSGVGGKVSLSYLSEKTEVVLFTKVKKGLHFKVTVPWDEMFKQQKYTNMIKVEPMNENEVFDFHKERENMENKDSGLTIRFKFNDTLADQIEKQFCSPDHYKEKYDIDINPIDMLRVIYGQFDIIISYFHFEVHETKIMQKYNYFGGNQSDYYKGITTSKVQVYEKKNKMRYILNMESEIKPFSKGFKKEIELVSESLTGWTPIGEYDVITGCRRDPDYFNDTNLKLPEGASDASLDYERQYIGDTKNEFLCKPSLVRNGQLICSIEMPDISIASRRANARALFGIRHLKSYVSYNPTSYLANKLDILSGIQENKNQNGGTIEIPFGRLIQHLMKEKEKEIWTYFEATINTNTENEDAENKSKRLQEEAEEKEKKEQEAAAKRAKKEARESKKNAKKAAIEQTVVEKQAVVEEEEADEVKQAVEEEEQVDVAEEDVAEEEQVDVAEEEEVDVAEEEQVDVAEEEEVDGGVACETGGDFIPQEEPTHEDIVLNFMNRIKEYDEEHLYLKINAMKHMANSEDILKSINVLSEFFN